MRIGTKILRGCGAQSNFRRENKKLTGCTYIHTHTRSPLLSRRTNILSVHGSYFCATTISEKQEIIWSGSARQHQCITTPLLWLVVGPPARKKASMIPRRHRTRRARRHSIILSCGVGLHGPRATLRKAALMAGVGEQAFASLPSLFSRRRCVARAREIPFPRGSKEVAGSSWEKSRTRDRNDQRSYRDGMRRNTHDTSV